MKDDYQDFILDPLPPQSRATPYGRAMLSMATFAGRALSATGFLLLMLAGATNLGATLMAVLLNRAAPGKGVPFLWIVGVAWLFWLLLAFLRWRINTAPPGPPGGQTWGVANAETTSVTAPERTSAEVALEASERAKRAAAEFYIRRSTPFPRVEAVQRSVRVLVGGEEQPAWVRFDLRPLVVTFMGVAVSIPVVMVSAVISLIGLLAATAPF